LAPAQVKATVDSFGAHGIDIDYEAESASQWDAELVRTNVIRYLRLAMPSPQYQIFFTIGGMMFYSATLFLRLFLLSFFWFFEITPSCLASM
jgi:hypothetical protein